MTDPASGAAPKLLTCPDCGLVEEGQPCYAIECGLTRGNFHEVRASGAAPSETPETGEWDYVSPPLPTFITRWVKAEIYEAALAAWEAAERERDDLRDALKVDAAISAGAMEEIAALRQRLATSQRVCTEAVDEITAARRCCARVFQHGGSRRMTEQMMKEIAHKHRQSARMLWNEHGVIAAIAEAVAAEMERTAKALEFAEYLAKAAEHFQEAISGAVNIPDEDANDDVATQDIRSDAWRNLTCSIYEFRKRAIRQEAGQAREG